VVEIAAGLMPSYVAFALMTPLLGLSALTMITAANAYMQLHTDAGMRGRVMALYMMIFIGGTPLGAPVIGWIGEVAGARWTLILGGLVTALGTGVAALWFAHVRGVLTPDVRASNLVPRVWDDQTVARAQKPTERQPTARPAEERIRAHTTGTSK
jgi:MFS family permease